MMTALVYVWLAGWIGTVGVQSYQCATKPPQRLISGTECNVIGVIAGAVMPVVVYRNLK